MYVKNDNFLPPNYIVLLYLSSLLNQQLNIILGVSALILLFGFILKRFNQPYIIAYILTGVILGPSGLKLVTEYDTAELIGEFGLIILMFFIGMEISLLDFIKKWRIALFGTGMQVLFSVGVIFILSLFFEWSLARIVLLGFIISLSSSAVVIEDNKMTKTQIGQNVISILLTQDILIVPMIIVMSFMSGKNLDYDEITLQIIGGVVILFFIFYLLRKKVIHIPYIDKLLEDHELQVFGALLVCFGMALFTSVFGLSAGLGAFIAGLFMNAMPSNKWLHDSLHSFRVVLISVFFLSVGMLIDLSFLQEYWKIVLIIVLGAFTINQLINALSLRVLKNSWSESFYGAALLAQVGEFSYVLASLGYHNEIILFFSYQMTVIVISITIFLSPLWAMLVRKILKVNPFSIQD
jgi:monovalent cation:H+ antiporter-2, CPA2 family